MEGIQSALAHRPTAAALDLGRMRARRLLVIAAGCAVVAVVVLSIVGVPAGDEERTGTGAFVLQVLAMAALVAAALLGLDGALRLRRAGFIHRVLSAGPWHVAGPYRSVSKPFGPPGTGRYETLIAVARPEPHGVVRLGAHGVVRGRLVGLKPGWRFASADEGSQLWVAGPTADRYVVGTTDGIGLALVKEPEGLRKVELGKHLEVLRP